MCKFLNFFVVALVVFVVAGNSNADIASSDNQNNNRLLEKNESQRMVFWNEYMREIGEDCNVSTDYFMGFDKEDAGYWSVDCNGSRIDGFLVQIPADVNASTKQFRCSVGEAIGISCFTSLE